MLTELMLQRLAEFQQDSAMEKVQDARTKARVTPYQFDDDARQKFALRVGLKVLACLSDNLDPAKEYKLADFTPDNQFAHILFRGVRQGSAV